MNLKIGQKVKDTETGDEGVVIVINKDSCTVRFTKTKSEFYNKGDCENYRLNENILKKL